MMRDFLPFRFTSFPAQTATVALDGPASNSIPAKGTERELSVVAVCLDSAKPCFPTNAFPTELVGTSGFSVCLGFWLSFMLVFCCFKMTSKISWLENL